MLEKDSASTAIRSDSPILVTGASGFIGKRLLDKLRERGANVRILARRLPVGLPGVQGDILSQEAVGDAVDGIKTVFHCAGYAHAFVSSAAEEQQHWRVNFEGTRNLAEAAGRGGVSRFVFLSSVKAMADPGDECADEDWPGEPATAYGKAKRAAEETIIAAGERYGMEVVILRLTMVYGPGGRGNLERMARLIQRGYFPPLPETGNRRSLVYVDDVVDAMLLTASHPLAAGRTYIIADRRSYSGRQLYDAISAAVGKGNSSWAVPSAILRMGAWGGDWLGGLLGRRLPFDSEVLDKLLGSACYSAARIEAELGWRAQTGLADGLSRMLRSGRETE